MQDILPAVNELSRDCLSWIHVEQCQESVYDAGNAIIQLLQCGVPYIWLQKMVVQNFYADILLARWEISLRKIQNKSTLMTHGILVISLQPVF